MSTPRPLLLLGAAAGATALALLTGCGPEPQPEPTTPVPPEQPVQPGPTVPGPTIPTREPSPPGDGTEEIDLNCDALVSPQAIYAFNSSFGLLDDWAPTEGSLGARALAADGVACRWVNGSGAAVLDVSAARPGAAGLAEVRDEVSGSEAAPYGEESWFGSDADGRGRLTVFADGAWLTVVSDYLGEAGDADAVVDAAMQALGMG